MNLSKNIKKLVVLCFPLLITSCASVTSGQHQPVSVSTGPVKGATCSLENNKGKWYVNNTPGSVTIQRSYNDMHVTCEKPGYKKVEKNVASSTKAITFGNVIFGVPGLVGAGVDVTSGAAYDYPTDIQLQMEREKRVA